MSDAESAKSQANSHRVAERLLNMPGSSIRRKTTRRACVHSQWLDIFCLGGEKVTVKVIVTGTKKKKLNHRAGNASVAS